MESAALSLFCEQAYRRFHHPEYIAPDPLEVVREFDSVRDREAVALIASSLALGRVDGIVRIVRAVVERLTGTGGTPAEVIAETSPGALLALVEGLRYRFFDARCIAGLLVGMRAVYREYGSLEACFAVGATRSSGNRFEPDDVVLRGLASLVEALQRGADGALDASILLSRPDLRSACKRLHLFTRWMVRSDAIDPGGWTVIAPSRLLVPVDTHVLKLARRLGLTRRKQASLLVSREVTAALRIIAPDDPVRYDFSLTRPGIHPMLDEDAFISETVHTGATKFATLG
jgi:uncharacterized protein (TIGR02757 family)